MRIAGIVGLTALAVGLSACASSKEEQREEAPATEQPAGAEQQQPGAEQQPAPGEQAQPQARANQAPRPKRPEAGDRSRAKAQVAVIDAALVSAAANARALETLGKDEKAYDPEDGQRLLEHAQAALTDAEENVQQLRESARGEGDRRQLDDLDLRISRASESFARISDAIDRPERVADEAGRASADLAAAVKPLRAVARAKGTGVEITGPTG